jgi:hypothetical protein
MEIIQVKCTNPRIPIMEDSTRAKHGKNAKSNRTTVGLWFSITPSRHVPRQKKPQKKSWQARSGELIISVI